MLRATLKSLLAHKMRLALSAVAVVLGVAFVAGSFVFTDTIDKTFKELFNQTSADVTVSPKPAFDTTMGATAVTTRTVSQEVLETVQGVEGVAVAEGQVTVDGVRMVGRDGKVVGQAGPPGLGVDWSDTPGLSALTITDGRAPARSGEVAIDSSAADKGDFSVGQRITLLVPEGPPIQQTVVGVFRFGDSNSLAGATVTAFDRASAQRLLLEPGQFSAIGLRADEGVSESTLRDRVAAAVPDTLQVQTRAETAAAATKAIQEGLGFLTTLLLAFAGVALFVGSFIIFNTFSMIVAQRTRELALLRAVGASRRQVTRSVMVEALAVGLVGSAVGLAAGLGIAQLLKAAFSAFGLEISTGSLVVELRTVVAAFAVGVLVTAAAAYLPARRASRIPPVAALQDTVALSAGSIHRRLVVGAVLAVAGVAALLTSLQVDDGGRAAQLLGVGVLATLLGVIALSPALSRPLVAALGWPVRRLRGTVGRLAVENAERNPRRTSATASALMIGLALVSAFGVLGASVNASVDRLVDRAIGADYVVSDAIGSAFGTEVARSVADVEGVDKVVRQRFGPVQVDGRTQQFASAVDTDGLDRAVQLDFVDGGLAGLRDGVLVDRAAAEGNDWQVGDRVEVTFISGETRQLPLRGIYERSNVLGSYVLSLDTWEAAGGDRRDNYLYVVLDDGVSPAAVASPMERAVAAFPNVALKDQTQFKDEQKNQINQLLSLIYALLALAIVIAVLGIVNTLALSVIERTREIGLLRAVGMSRRQLRSMVRWESVVIAVFGAVLGLALGVGFGTALQRILVDQGIDILSVPVGSLLVFLGLAALVGVLAAVWPARRAARLDVLRAITTE